MVAHASSSRLFGIALLVLSCGSGKAARDGGGGAGGGGAGGTNDTSTCATVLPCGGDVVGTWKVNDSCLTLTEISALRALVHRPPSNSCSLERR